MLLVTAVGLCCIAFVPIAHAKTDALATFNSRLSSGTLTRAVFGEDESVDAANLPACSCEEVITPSTNRRLETWTPPSFYCMDASNVCVPITATVGEPLLCLKGGTLCKVAASSSVSSSPQLRGTVAKDEVLDGLDNSETRNGPAQMVGMASASGPHHTRTPWMHTGGF